MSKLLSFSFRAALATASALINTAHTRAGDWPAIAGMWRPHVGGGIPRVKLRIAERVLRQAQDVPSESRDGLRTGMMGGPHRAPVPMAPGLFLFAR